MPLELALRIREGRSRPPRMAVLDALSAGPDDGAPTCEVGRPATGSTCLVVLDEMRDPRDIARVIVPLVRAPFLVDDLVPALVGAARALAVDLVDERRGEALHDAEQAVAHVLEARRLELTALTRVCVETGAPLPAALPAATLARLHAWLLRLDALVDGDAPVARVVFGLDARNGEDVILASLAPKAPRIRVPPFAAVVVDAALVAALASRSARPGLAPGEASAARLVETSRLTVGAGPDEDGLFVIALDDAAARVVDESMDISGFRLLSPCEIVDRESLMPDDGA